MRHFTMVRSLVYNTHSQTQLYYLYYYNKGSNNDMFRPYMWAIFRL